MLKQLFNLKSFQRSVAASLTVLSLAACGNNAPEPVGEGITIDTRAAYPQRSGYQAEFNQNCAQTGQGPSYNPGPQTAWEKISALWNNGGLFSRGLYRFSDEAEIYTCWYKNPFNAEQFDRSTGVTQIYMTTDKIHESIQAIRAITHAYQNLKGYAAYGMDWSLQSRFTQHLVNEAIVNASLWTVAYELWSGGQGDMWDRLQKSSPETASLFLQQIGKGVETAASALINASLQDSEFIDYHSLKFLTDYFWELYEGKLQGEGKDMYTQDMAVSAGKFTESELNLARYVVLPPFILPSGQKAADLINLLESFRRQMPLAAESNGYAGITLNSLAEQIKKSQGKYYAQQAADRLKAAYKWDTAFPSRANISNLYENCFQADYEWQQVQTGIMDLWRNIYNTEQHDTLVGRKAVDFAKEAGLFFCWWGGMDEGTGGQISDGEGVVKINSESGVGDNVNLMIEVHEIIHGIQGQKGVLNYDMSWSLADFQMADLAYEGAARIGEYLAAYELHRDGYSGPWREARDPGIAADVEYHYRQAEAAGYDRILTLEYAGAHAWQNMFTVQSWLDFYNKHTLNFYLRLLVNGNLVGTGRDGAVYSIDTARMAGWLSDDLNYTRGIASLPAYQDRFGSNALMKQAFDYVELERLARALGRRDQRYLADLTRLENEGNPYLGVNLDVVQKDAASNEKLDILEIMNCYAGVTACTLGNAPLNPNQFRIQLR